MDYFSKKKEGLIEENDSLRRRIRELEQSAVEQARAEEALRASEEKFRRFFDNAMEGIYRTTPEGGLAYANMAFAVMHGYASPEEMINTVKDVGSQLYADPEDRKRLMAVVLEKGRIDNFECRMRRRDGAAFWVAINARSAFSKDGARRIEGFVVDISERKQKEAAMNEYSHKLKERAKEINCLYAVSEIVRKDDVSREAMLCECASCLSQAYQFPEITGCCITWGDREYATENFTRTAWMQSCAIIVHGGQVGTVEVAYLEERKEEFEGPFMAEERQLLNSVAELLGKSEERKRAEEALLLTRFAMDRAPDGILLVGDQGNIEYANDASCTSMSYTREELQRMTVFDIDPDFPREGWQQHMIDLKRLGKMTFRGRHLTKDGRFYPVEVTSNYMDYKGLFLSIAFDRDITDRLRAQEALERRIVALTQPLEGVEGISFEDLFNMSELQLLQDLTADAWGVAALITRPDGTPITRPSNFTYFCGEFIRKNRQGFKNCQTSDAMLGRHNPSGPVIQQCMSAGLWGAGASITVGGRHIANWLVGQVRNEAQREEHIVEYARIIGADEAEFREAFLRVPVMQQEKFEQVAYALFALANQLSITAYQNIQQARFIAERKQAEEALATERRRLSDILEGTNVGTWEWNVQTKETVFNEKWAEIIGYSLEELAPVSIDTWMKYTHPDDLNASNDLLEKHFKNELPYYECESRMRHKNGTWVWVLDRGRVSTWTDEGKPLLMSGTHQDITERKRAEEEREKLIAELKDALSQVKTLRGLLPICASCKKIRNDKGYWEQMEVYIRDHSEADFSHGICPECARKLYPEIYGKKE